MAEMVKALPGGKSSRDIGDVARALRRTRRELEGNIAAPYIEKAADGLDRISGLLREGDPRDMVRSAERYSRREPLLFIGGAFALGLIAARFLKSSAHRERGADEEEPVKSARSGAATAPSPVGDYGPTEPGQGPFPGGGAVPASTKGGGLS